MGSYAGPLRPQDAPGLHPSRNYWDVRVSPLNTTDQLIIGEPCYLWGVDFVPIDVNPAVVNLHNSLDASGPILFRAKSGILQKSVHVHFEEPILFNVGLYMNQSFGPEYIVRYSR